MEALELDSRIYEARYMGLTQQMNTERPVLEGRCSKLIICNYILFIYRDLPL